MTTSRLELALAPNPETTAEALKDAVADSATAPVVEPVATERIPAADPGGLMVVPEPRDREFVERTRKLIGQADLDARAVAAELLA